MKFLFDNNLSPHLAAGIARLSAVEPNVQEVVHLRDRFHPATQDVKWIEALASSGEQWVVISIDKFTKSKGAEREALRRAGLTVYVLDPQWGKHQYWKVAGRMVQWWPQIVQHASLTKGGVYRIQWRPSQGHRFAAY